MRFAFWKRFAALLLCLCLVPLAGFAATKTDITVTLDVNPDASANHKDLAKDLQSVLKMTKLNGTLYLKDNTPVWEKPVFRLEGALNIKNRDYVTASAWGREDAFDILCSAMGSDTYAMNMGHWYAFIAKFNHFMSLDLIPLSYLVYPYGTYAAWAPVMDVLTEMESAALENGGAMSGETVAEYAQQIADLSWDNGFLYGWISFFLKDRGVNDELGYCMEELGDWAWDITADEGLYVEKDDTRCVWTLGGQEVYRYEAGENGSHWQIIFPEKTGADTYRMTMARSWTESASGAELMFDVNVLLEDDSNLFGATVTASGLPCDGCDAASGRLTVSVRGELYGSLQTVIAYDWQSKDGNTRVDARLMTADGSDVMGSVSALLKTSECAENFDTALVKGAYDLMAVSDSTAPEFLAKVKTPLTKLSSAFMMILPRNIINFAGDLLERYSILSILESGSLEGVAE